MKMNKTEKLLAARKRLKEFQLTKRNHTQENAIKQQNDTSVDPVSQDHDVAVITSQSSENNGNVTCNADKGNQMIEEKLITTQSPDFYDTIDKDKRVEEFISNENSSYERVEVTNNHKDELNCHILPLTNTTSEHERAMEEVIQQSGESIPVSSHISSFPSAQQNKTEPSIESGSLNDPLSLQKECLLQIQMATSAMADAMVDGLEYDESTALNSDLEYQNQFLTSCLKEQKELVNQLHVQVSQYSSRVSELEAILAIKDAEFETKLLREVNPLKEQLQFHMQTTGILVGEKAELTAALTQCQSTVKRKIVETEDLSGKLKASQLHVGNLEKELMLIKSNIENTGKTSQQLQHDYNDINNKYSELRKEKEDLDLEMSELNQKLNVKNVEVTNLQQQLQEKTALLSLNELKFQQVQNSFQETQMIENQRHSITVLEQQLAQLRDTLKSLNDEKHEANKQYQSYVQQLDTRHLKLVNELEAERQSVTKLEEREQNYIQRLSDLEQQLQREKEKVNSLLPLQNYKEQVDALTKSIDELVVEQDSLQIALDEKNTDIETLKKELEELKELKEQGVEAQKLALALESERLGASRAVSQNQQLKQQLNEMHDAFVLLSNTKLDLTEQLQAERSIGKKLNAELNKIESERNQLKEQLEKKEAILLELEKDKLHTAQITDQMQHYQAQSHHASTLQQELKLALENIERLKKENQYLSDKSNSEQRMQIDGTDTSINSVTEHCSEDQQSICEDLNIVAKSTVAIQAVLQPQEDALSIIPGAMKKLEERFKETMEKVADLSDEKQRLEHLVLQLQGETETIGEYITLYQKQRAILQEKAKEKEQAFRQLIDQRNQQQEQLHKLKVLVADLIKKPAIPPITSNETTIIASRIDQWKEDSNEPNMDKGKNCNHAVDEKDNTTSQILDLLTEIKDCKDTCILEPNFHPCPWCSGKLLTV